MAPTLKTKPALVNYKPLKYSHFDVEPGFRYMLTADPWGYLRVYLTEEAAKRRPKARWKSALAFLELAEGFYTAAQAASHPTKAVLVYYSMLNLMKVVMSAVGGIDLGITPEHHGLTLGTGTDISIKLSSSPTQRNIFFDFANILGVQPRFASVRLEEAMLNIPEIHELVVSLLKPTDGRSFVPVNVEFVVDDRGEGNKPKYLWSRLSYDKKEDGQIKNLRKKVHGRIGTSKFKDPYEDASTVIYECKRRSLKHTDRNWGAVYKNICKDHYDSILYSLLTRQGYKYYVNLNKPPLPQLCYPVLLCFYLGSICRYRPMTLDETMAGPIGPAITEALSICPRQFLYQVAGVVTKKVVVVPQASI